MNAATKQAHALEACESVRNGSVIECRCGWVAHVKAGDGLHRKAAMKALAAHKKEATK